MTAVQEFTLLLSSDKVGGPLQFEFFFTFFCLFFFICFFLELN